MLLAYRDLLWCDLGICWRVFVSCPRWERFPCCVLLCLATTAFPRHTVFLGPFFVLVTLCFLFCRNSVLCVWAAYCPSVSFTHYSVLVTDCHLGLPDDVVPFHRISARISPFGPVAGSFFLCWALDWHYYPYLALRR